MGGSAIQAVVDVVASVHERLEALSWKLMEEDGEKIADLLGVIQDKLDKMEPETFEPRACELPHELGFTRAMTNEAAKDMSGGWRMSVALTQALFVEPMLLPLDEPTNHLGLGACVWLDVYLSRRPSTLLSRRTSRTS